MQIILRMKELVFDDAVIAIPVASDVTKRNAGKSSIGRSIGAICTSMYQNQNATNNQQRRQAELDRYILPGGFLFASTKGPNLGQVFDLSKQS